MAFPDLAMRSAFIEHMRHEHVQVVFHYQALSASAMGLRLGAIPGACSVAEAASDTTVRLPVFSDMRPDEIAHILQAALSFTGVA